MAHTRGRRPSNLTGQLPVSSPVSPWWDQVALRITSDPTMVGNVFTIEELVEHPLVTYPDGRRPRGRTVARRLRSILEMVEPGPNGSRGHGARYRICPPETDVLSTHPPRIDLEEDGIASDDDWLEQQIKRMTGD